MICSCLIRLRREACFLVDKLPGDRLLEDLDTQDGQDAVRSGLWWSHPVSPFYSVLSGPFNGPAGSSIPANLRDRSALKRSQNGIA